MIGDRPKGWRVYVCAKKIRILGSISVYIIVEERARNNKYNNDYWCADTY